MGKLSISLDDDLLAELRISAGDNVSRFVALAVRRQLERQQLTAYVAELEAEFGPPSEASVAEADAAFDRVEAANARLARRRDG